MLKHVSITFHQKASKQTNNKPHTNKQINLKTNNNNDKNRNKTDITAHNCRFYM